MKVVLWRKYRKAEYTIGKVYIDGAYFCDCCEDTDRGLAQYMSVGEIMTQKVAGRTAIPVGEYKITRTYSPRFKRVVPQVMNVKGFSGVRVHAGNSAKDTEGCLLFGKNTIKGGVTQSRAYCTKFDTMLQVNGGTCDLSIVWEYNE